MVERTLISLSSQLQLIERLQHIIYLSSSLIFVSGEPGSGKSTLTENLSNALNSDLQQIYISLSNTPSIGKLRQQIIGQLYENPLFNSEDNLLDTILRLQASETKECNKLLIIDNADHLPESFILELCELFSGEDFIRDNTLNILLLADETTNEQYLDYIENNLISRMRSSLEHVEFKLPPLSTEESFSLLEHNFKQVDYKPDPQSPEKLTSLLKECAGNPKKIIQLADDLSQGSVLPPRKYWLKTALPATLLMLLLVGIVSALGTYLYPKFIVDKKVEVKIKHEVIEQKTQKEELLEHLLIQEKRMQEVLAGEWDNADNLDDANAVIENNQQEVLVDELGDADNLDDANAVIGNNQQEVLAGEWDNADTVGGANTVIENNQQEYLPEQKGQQVVISDEELVKLVSAVEANTKKLLENKVRQSVTALPLALSEDETTQSEVQHEQFLPIDSQQNEDNKSLLSSLRDEVGLDIKNEIAVDPASEVIEPSTEHVGTPEITPVTIKNEIRSDVEQVQVEDDVLSVEETSLQAEVLEDNSLLDNTSPDVPIQESGKPELPVSNVLIKQTPTELTPRAILFNKPPENYTLQLSGMASKRYLDLFKQKFKFPQENLFLYETVYQNKPWFVVLYGDYDSVNTAQVAARNLPEAFKAMSSWVKQWQLVHDELRLNND